MTKSELIKILMDQFPHLLMEDTELAVKTVLDKVVSALECGEKTEIRGFGSLSVHMRNARVARNPKTGEKVNIPPKRVLHFKAGLELRNRVSEKIGSRGL